MYKYKVGNKEFRTLMGATDYSNVSGYKIVTLTNHLALFGNK